jgi:poly(3-hydroxybutyrate) depolymerase
MKSLSAFIIIPIVCIFVTGCSQKADIDEPAINCGDGFFYFNDKTISESSAMRVYYYKPTRFTADRPIVFLMHGADRKVEHIPKEAAKYLEKFNILLILPEYSEQLFPKIEAYQYGNVRTRPKELWTYYVNDRIFELVKRLTGSQQKKYYIWGNSAGAQFVHRQLIVGASEFIEKAFASNAGVYTMPTRGTDPYPYSLKGLDVTDEDLKRIFSLNFLILLGEEDVTQDAYFLKTKAAMRQGGNRLQRGKKFYSTAQKEAQRLNLTLKWQLITIAGCGHNPNDEMINVIINSILSQK